MLRAFRGFVYYSRKRLQKPSTLNPLSVVSAPIKNQKPNRSMLGSQLPEPHNWELKAEDEQNCVYYSGLNDWNRALGPIILYSWTPPE